MNIIKNIFNRTRSAGSRTVQMFRFLAHVYRYGGYATVTVANVNSGGTLKDKRILITGGGSGIGLAIARKCLREGAVVLITGRNASKLQDVLESEHDKSLKSLAWDVSDIKALQAKVQQAESLLGGGIDILVNNAGIVNGVDFSDVTEEIWDKVYATNSKGLFFLTQAICKRWMKDNHRTIRKIINISSQGGFVGATYPYRMTKWDVAGLTQGLGLKLAPHGILVNGIAPGITATDALPFVLEQKENLYTRLVPAGRFALPQEMAELAGFLMSDAANFIVGQTIVCDGGYTLK
jgi:3-oxoacyl-[acyl-carrier protein] reductase